jgi:hypothetical protein
VKRDAAPTRTTYITATTTIIGYQQFASLANKLVKFLIEKILENFEHFSFRLSLEVRR